jgi:hypothetical protein
VALCRLSTRLLQELLAELDDQVKACRWDGPGRLEARALAHRPAASGDAALGDPAGRRLA